MKISIFTSLKYLVGRGPKEYHYDNLKNAIYTNTAEIILDSHFENCVTVKYTTPNSEIWTIVRKEIVDSIMVGNTEELDKQVEDLKSIYWIYK